MPATPDLGERFRASCGAMRGVSGVGICLLNNARRGIKFAAAERRNVPVQSVQVTIVAVSAETLDGLQGYLSRAGVGARCTRDLVGAHAAPCSAVVFFPDDFSLDEVIQELGRLRRERPSVLPLLVTGQPQRYLSAGMSEGKGPAPIVMPRPAWGWMILDAIRGAAFPDEGSE
jgi:hypothetical protein